MILMLTSRSTVKLITSVGYREAIADKCPWIWSWLCELGWYDPEAHIPAFTSGVTWRQLHNCAERQGPTMDDGTHLAGIWESWTALKAPSPWISSNRRHEHKTRQTAPPCLIISQAMGSFGTQGKQVCMYPRFHTNELWDLLANPENLSPFLFSTHLSYFTWWDFNVWWLH